MGVRINLFNTDVLPPGKAWRHWIEPGQIAYLGNGRWLTAEFHVDAETERRTLWLRVQWRWAEAAYPVPLVHHLDSCALRLVPLAVEYSESGTPARVFMEFQRLPGSGAVAA